METSSNNYINLTYLKELSNGSNEFICQMITVFMEQTPDAVNSMEKYLNAKDWQALHAIAHKTKASFAFMGIKELESVTCLVEEYSLNKTNLEQLYRHFLFLKSFRVIDPNSFYLSCILQLNM